ncbi:DUF2157 domain-containing protein [Leptolyngbya sp. FACHB-541]|uniref:DUF2157 domain-containing protein n=1 Tax=Leptolyngbya sp. FACHB-541 TaxID=2692810 RepID=UPI001684D3BB|nr:DUF2157 domain-containing protein [Leptolyngbya sp. FACHB-541]MBD1996923.1 DUF2157 domain-containing protein [Leptolyngbya sp. FACHB-541]
MSFQPDRLIELKLVTQAQAELLQGLETWLSLDLISADDIELTLLLGKVPNRSELSQPAIQLDFSTQISPQKLLEGLDAWHRLGLLKSGQIEVKLSCLASHANLLKGLEVLLKLGLLPETQVKALGQVNLACDLQKAEADDFAPIAPPQPVKSRKPAPTPKPPEPAALGLVAQMLHSLMAELSVLWLLLLGMFLVVVSSGVLAASQWQRFPAAGQYGILLFYTLGFWGASVWAGRQQNLRLTAQALRVVSLLLLPVNFLAMDSFGLWRSLLGAGIAAIATLTLTALAIYHFRANRQDPQQTQLTLVNHLGLSYLQWGWGLPGFALIAVYAGVIATAAITLLQSRQETSLERPFRPFSLNRALIVYTLAILLIRAIFIAEVEVERLGLAVGICGFLLAWLARQEIAQSGRSPTPLSPLQPATWETIGGILLGLGWLISVGSVPWQALGVSGLGLWFFGDRLYRFRYRRDLVILFLIGLQMHWLAWRLLPLVVQQQAVTLATQLTGTQSNPDVLLCLGLFPYLVLTVVTADWLDRRQQRNLTACADQIAIWFGVVLLLLSLFSPILRTITFALSTLTLAIANHQRWSRGSALLSLPQSAKVSELIRIGSATSEHLSSTSSRSTPPSFLASHRSSSYLIHLGGLATVLSAVDWILPTLNLGFWAGILLVLAVSELVLSLGLHTTNRRNGDQRNGNWAIAFWTQNRPNRLHSAYPPALWRQSFWTFGFILAALSFGLFWLNNLLLSGAETSFGQHGVSPKGWGMLWLVVPLSLTWIASLTRPPHRQTASWAGVWTLMVVQVLTLPLPTLRLVGLGLATGLMVLHTRTLWHLTAAAIAVGFGLGFVVTLLAEELPGSPQLSARDWLLVVAILLTVLWVWRSVLLRRSTPLSQLYARAMDGWAIALYLIELLCLTFDSLGVYWDLLPASALAIGSVALILGAIAYRSWQSPTNWAIYGFGWGLEVLTIETLGLTGRSIAALAIANLALGLASQLVGDWWNRRSDNRQILSSWHVMPLVYGALGATLRWGIVEDWTGLSTLGLSLIAIGVGRRKESFKPLIYLALAGLFASGCEILLYQVAGLRAGDQLVAIAALATSFVYVYRILTPWLIPFLRLNTDGLTTIAHLHWALGSIFLVAATQHPVSTYDLLAVGTGIFLVRYALAQGRIQDNPRDADGWVYAGILEAVGIAVYGLTLLPDDLLAQILPWRGAIATLFACILHLLPWQEWGWRSQPWQRSAYVLPLAALILSNASIQPLSLVVAAASYLLFARTQYQIRLTYLSLLLVEWAIALWLTDIQRTFDLLYPSLVGLFILYVAQVDPDLKRPNAHRLRHLLRTLGSGIICLFALLFHHQTGILPGIISLVTLFAGLSLRVRAFLYVGTIIFLVNAFYQLVILIFDYPLLKWIVGLMVGIALIWLAANFETRRSQLGSFLRNWFTDLQGWQ